MDGPIVECSAVQCSVRATYGRTIKEGQANHVNRMSGLAKFLAISGIGGLPGIGGTGFQGIPSAGKPCQGRTGRDRADEGIKWHG